MLSTFIRQPSLRNQLLKGSHKCFQSIEQYIWKRLPLYESLPFSACRSFCSDAALPDLGSNHRSVMSLNGDRIRPIKASNAFIAPSATVVGVVDLAEKVVIWYGSVLRADFAEIVISALSVVEENCVLTVAPPKESGDLKPIHIGSWVVIESHSLLKSCNVESRTRIGSHSIIEEGAFIDMDCIILPYSVIPANQRIPTGEVWGGNPAKFIRKVDPDEVDDTIQQAENTFYFTRQHIAEFLPKGFAYIEKERLLHSVNSFAKKE